MFEGSPRIGFLHLSSEEPKKAATMPMTPKKHTQEAGIFVGGRQLGKQEKP